MITPTPRPQPPASPREHWAVTVERDGDPILTIGHNHLSGRYLQPGDEETIRNAARHLLSFIGDPANLDGPASGARGEAETTPRYGTQAPQSTGVLWCQPDESCGLDKFPDNGAAMTTPRPQPPASQRETSDTKRNSDPKLQFALIAQIADEGVKFHAHWSSTGLRARLGLIRIALEDLESLYEHD